MANKNPSRLALEIRDSAIDNQDQLFELAKIAASKDGLVISKYIGNFGIENPDRLFEIAIIAFQQITLSGKAHKVINSSIEDFALHDQAHRIEIVRWNFLNNPPNVRPLNISLFQIQDIQARYELANLLFDRMPHYIHRLEEFDLPEEMHKSLLRKYIPPVSEIFLPKTPGDTPIISRIDSHLSQYSSIADLLHSIPKDPKAMFWTATRNSQGLIATSLGKSPFEKPEDKPIWRFFLTDLNHHVIYSFGGDKAYHPSHRFEMVEQSPNGTLTSYAVIETSEGLQSLGKNPKQCVSCHGDPFRLNHLGNYAKWKGALGQNDDFISEDPRNLIADQNGSIVSEKILLDLALESIKGSDRLRFLQDFPGPAEKVGESSPKDYRIKDRFNLLFGKVIFQMQSRQAAAEILSNPSYDPERISYGAKELAELAPRSLGAKPHPNTLDLSFFDGSVAYPGDLLKSNLQGEAFFKTGISYNDKDHFNPFIGNRPALWQISLNNFFGPREIPNTENTENQEDCESCDIPKIIRQPEIGGLDEVNPFALVCARCHGPDEIPYNDPEKLQSFTSSSGKSILEHLKGENGARLMPPSFDKQTDQKTREYLIDWYEALPLKN